MLDLLREALCSGFDNEGLKQSESLPQRAYILRRNTHVQPAHTQISSMTEKHRLGGYGGSVQVGGCIRGGLNEKVTH